MISEIETCVYDIHINSNQICNIPNFNKKSNNYKIDCNPVLDGHLFNQYSRKIHELEQKKQEKQTEIALKNKKVKDDLAQENIDEQKLLEKSAADSLEQANKMYELNQDTQGLSDDALAKLQKDNAVEIQNKVNQLKEDINTGKDNNDLNMFDEKSLMKVDDLFDKISTN